MGDVIILLLSESDKQTGETKRKRRQRKGNGDREEKKKSTVVMGVRAAVLRSATGCHCLQIWDLKRDLLFVVEVKQLRLATQLISKITQSQSDQSHFRAGIIS